MALNTSHPAARRYFSALLEKSAFQSSYLLDSPLVKRIKPGESIPSDAVIVMEDAFLGDSGNGGNKGSGYRIDYSLDGPVYGIPTAGDNTISGAKKLALFNDTIEINQNRFPLESDGEFAEGLVPWDFLMRVRQKLTDDYFPHYWDERLLCKASGSLGSNSWVTLDPTAATSSARDVDGSPASDGNDLRAPSSNRVIYGNGRANQAAITTSDYCTLDILDRAVKLAVRPSANVTLKRTVPHLLIRKRPSFVWVIDITQAADLASKTNERFYDLQRAQIQGGNGKGNEIANWSTYFYSTLGYDVYIVVHPNLVKFSAAATGGQKVCRSLLFGRGAMRVALGRKTKSIGAFSWYQRELDEGNKTRVTAGVTEGIQKCAYSTTETGNTREDYAVIAIDTYADH
jgi:hypothetical protein